MDGTVPSTKFLLDGTVPATKHYKIGMFSEELFVCEKSRKLGLSYLFACAEGLVDNCVITVYDNLSKHKHIRTTNNSYMRHKG